MLEWMIRSYFTLNVLLYGALAVRTSLDRDGTARSAGLSFGSAAARSEYPVSQDGLLVSLVALFAPFALAADSHGIGLKVSIAFYGPILTNRLMQPLFASERFRV